MAQIRMSDPIYFNGVNLLSINGFSFTGTDTNRFPKRDVNNFTFAQGNGSSTPSAFYGSKLVNVRGVFKLSGRELLDESLSELYRILEGKEVVLQLPISGEQRKFLKTTVQNVAISDMAGGYCRVDIEFLSNERFNYALTTTEVLNIVNLTSGNKSYPVTFEGKGEQAPIITYTIDAHVAPTSVVATFSNPIGNSISVDWTPTNSDVLVFNCLTKEVTLNGDPLDYTGNFPEWDKGAGFINYTDNFTSRQVDINVTYTKRYK